MSKTKLMIKDVEKKAKNSQEYITLQNYEGSDKPEITLEVTQGPDKCYHYFKVSSKTGRETISRSEAQELFKKYNVYSS